MVMAKNIFLFLLIVSASAQAEIYKFALPTDSGMKFYWWPVLPEVAGWHHDRNYSIHYSSNAQAPDGFDFGNAETVIYAKAIYKPRVPKLKTLESFIEADQSHFKSTDNVLINEATAMVTADEAKLISFTYTPNKTGNWEQVAFGEEGEFYLTFVISSRSKSGFENSWASYVKFVSNYKMQP